MTAAILDRLLHKSVVLNMRGGATGCVTSRTR